MNYKNLSITIVIVALCGVLFSQSAEQVSKNESKERKFSFSTTYLTFANFGNEKTNTHHYEFHFGYQITSKDRIGIKMATWQLFAPMGIPLWDPNFLNEEEFFPGRLKEMGIGVSYQRKIWKGFFATVEILPLYKTYVDQNKVILGHGFKLYSTFHLGYQFNFFKNRFYIEPQIHCNYWSIDTEAPESFQVKENKWHNFFPIEPNLYIGIKF